MNAMLVIQTKNGYAVAPYTGEIPANFVQDMHVATTLKSYSYASDTVMKALSEHFEPAELKEAA
jgi:hypothetical protein